MNYQIRKMVADDSEQVFVLMEELAVFEKYIDSFAITPKIVRQCGFEKNPPDFYAFVAEMDGDIFGVLVYYYLPYTAQNRPAIYMKELYVAQRARNQQVGEQLINALKDEAKRHQVQTIKWTVAPWNESGIRFYERLGAVQNADWLNYELNVE